MANDYLATDEFKLRSQKQPQDIPKENELLEALITSACRWIDRHCLRDPGDFQTQGNSAATRYFDGKGRVDAIWIDDCTSISSVQQADYPYTTYTAMTADTDYWKSDGDQYDATPYRMLELNPNSSSFAYWASGGRAVKVSAVWGYSITAPEPVKEAVAIMARKLYHLRDGVGEGDATAITDFGVIVPAAIPAKVKAFLAPYKRNPL